MSSQSLLQQLHSSGNQFVLAITGGGSSAIGELLAVPGASRTLLSAYVPYSVLALQDFVHEWHTEPGCQEATARRMAVEAFEIAGELVEPETPVHGVACTASLASDRPKRGDHRIHVAAQSAQRTAVASLTLEKGARTRAEEEQLAAALVLDVTLEAAGIQGTLAAPLLKPTEQIQRTVQVAPPEWPVMGSDVAWRAGMESGAAPTEPPKLVLPGAFNPLHDGHRRMAAVAEELTGLPITFELSVANVDKPPLDFVEISRRVAQFDGRDCLVTRAPTFVDKATLMPGATFVVGLDTLIRIADEAYYDDSEAVRDDALSHIAGADCRFLVFGRAFDDEFLTLDDLELPPALAAICTGVSEEVFREDISSTELREAE